MPLVAAALALVAAPHTAMTYNVLFEGGDPAATLALIERASPEILCLQEVTPGFARRATARLQYPYSAIEARHGTWGVAIFSKLPLRKPVVFAQAPHKMPAIEADVEVEGSVLHVVCVHLFPSGARRKASADLTRTLRDNDALRVGQARNLVRRYPKAPVLLLGDFNEGPEAAAAQVLLEAGWTQACAIKTSRCGSTWPGATSRWPAIVQIDQIFGRGLVFEAASVLRGGGSDHFPACATFAWGE